MIDDILLNQVVKDMFAIQQKQDEVNDHILSIFKIQDKMDDEVIKILERMNNTILSLALRIEGLENKK